MSEEHEQNLDDGFEESDGEEDTKKTKMSVYSEQHPQAWGKRMFSRAMKILHKGCEKTSEEFEKERIKIFEKEAEEERRKLRIVKLSCIPEGFIERDIQRYFEQFGEITRTVLVKSAKTGRSRHFAFIEFENPEVARIAAETMNNYVVFKRIMKASLVTSQFAKKYWATKFFVPDNCPGYVRMKENAARVNKRKSIVQEVKLKNRRIMKLKKKLVKLKEMGFDYMYLPRIELNKEQSVALGKLAMEKRRRKLNSALARAELNMTDTMKKRIREECTIRHKKMVEKEEGKREAKKAKAKKARAKKKMLKEMEMAMEQNTEAEISKGEGKVLNSSGDSLSSNHNKLVMEIDESDTEIEFKTPPNVIKRKLVREVIPNSPYTVLENK